VVQLWCARAGEIDCDLSPLLTAEERSRAERFLFAGNRQEFIIGRALVRLVLSRNLDVSPGEVRLRLGSFGKPELEWNATSALHFNVSHSAGLVVAAFSREGEVGVDVEDIQREISPAVLHQVFTPSELQQIASLPPNEQRAAAAARWTLKEAYLKARGAGLNLPLLGFSFVRTPECSPQISFSPQIDDESARWRFHHAPVAPRYVVSLAQLDLCAQVTHHDFAPARNAQVLHDSFHEPFVAVG
jgi:4'-phosphopantetheinyl transferase